MTKRKVKYNSKSDRKTISNIELITTMIKMTEEVQNLLRTTQMISTLIEIIGMMVMTEIEEDSQIKIERISKKAAKIIITKEAIMT